LKLAGAPLDCGMDLLPGAPQLKRDPLGGAPETESAGFATIPDLRSATWPRGTMASENLAGEFMNKAAQTFRQRLEQVDVAEGMKVIEESRRRRKRFYFDVIEDAMCIIARRWFP